MKNSTEILESKTFTKQMGKFGIFRTPAQEEEEEEATQYPGYTLTISIWFTLYISLTY